MRVTLKAGVSIIFLVFIWFLVAVPTGAEETGGPYAGLEDGVFDLGEVVVTAESETITQVTSVESIEREQIDLTNATDVAKVLETLPGVAVSVGTRNEAYINVRGFSQRYVPIFYDGIPLYIPYDGYVDASELSTGNVSRITLTKGTASVLYGANTMGGVINIVSMKPEEALEGSYKIEISEDGESGTVNLGSNMDRFYLMAGLSGMNTDGYEMSGDFTPIPSEDWYEDGGTRDNSDMESLSGSFKVGFTPAEGHEYALGVQHVDNERGLPPNIYESERQRFWRFTDWEKTTYYLIGDSKVMDNSLLKVRLFYDTYYNVLDAYDDHTYTTQDMRYAWTSVYDDHTFGGSLFWRSTFNDQNTLSLSFHYKDDVHESQFKTYAWESYEAETYSFGVEDDLKISDNLAAVLGISYDLQKEKEAFDGRDYLPLRGDDDVWNGLAGLSYQFEDETRINLSVARKSRFPTLKELYSDYMGSSVANPNLQKETSTNYEVGVERPLPGESHAGLALFLSDFQDKINETTVVVDGEEYDFNANIDEAKYQGVEVSFKTEGIPNNILEAHYTYLDAEDESDDPLDHLPETPKHHFYLSDHFMINDMFSLFAKMNYKKGQWEEKRNGSFIELDSYWTVDLKATADINEALVVELGARNLFDENYETGYGFPREGRTLFVGLRGSF